ncbi:ubiquitin carboxyl-terminal hydrolase 16, partial [Agrilus planipennis]|uniref:Ubiquitin carboxyl-terminal hydrolase 16 n=1 Tax=Agrilus planipennis TaxID=224129 RepID=A0A1W4X6H9_AGRPL
MGKKKRQGEPNSNSDESTESCDENQNMTECPHINKGVELQRVKKALRQNGFQTKCEECLKEPSSNSLESNSIIFDSSLWMCLKCGNQGCGRYQNQHALKHHNNPRCDCHTLCVNTTTWSVWCYTCDLEINVTARKKLLEVVEYLKKQSETTKVTTISPMSNNDNKVVEVMDTKTSLSFSNGGSDLSLLPRTRGLMNLGNTCFFNSVMQCLGQTPYLLNLLQETSQPGQYFKLPGGKLKIDDNTIDLGPLDGHLEEWRPLTRVLAETLEELQSGRPEVYNPRFLFSKLTQRMPQFAGGHQHDAHELLRHLLEAVREEDLRRYQTVILEKMDDFLLENLRLSKKTDPSSVEGEKKQIIRFYGQQASELLLPTEQVFRGVLVSTLQCKECDHMSHRNEFFLDLSLPIAEKQLPPVLRRKAEEIDDNKQSKHQIKKERKLARKNKKQKGSRSSFSTVSNHNVTMTEENKSDDNNSESESDADIEDNADENSFKKMATETQSNEDIPKGTESGYNSDKIDNGSPDSNVRSTSPEMRVDDSGVPSPAVGMLSVSPIPPTSPENSPASSETNIDMGSPLMGHNSPNDEINEDFERPQSRLAFVNNKNTDLKVDLAKLSLLNDGDSNKMDSIFSGPSSGSKMQLDINLEGACGGYEDDEQEKMEEDFDDGWTGTMSARYQCEEGECSVQSCLNQFTARELMTGNNKVSCDLCTKRHGSNEKKPVYTNATKQLLIYNPPAVLILHLKRFQVCRYRSAKIAKYVSFPPTLDLAPFCSKRCQNLPTFETGQTKVNYSLYGVV